MEYQTKINCFLARIEINIFYIVRRLIELESALLRHAYRVHEEAGPSDTNSKNCKY